MMSEEDVALLDIARANHARRKFNLTLSQHCLQTVARNEEYFTTRSVQTALLNKLEPQLKNRILAELSEQVFGELRYPATKRRVNLLQILIHPHLEKFDFVVLGNKFGRADNQQVWKCLAEKAGASLCCVQDLRIKNHTQKTRTLAWCLPYLTFMPQLEQLLITTLCCSAGELENLIEGSPKLKSLQLNLHTSFDPEEMNRISDLKDLEELVVYSCNGKVESKFILGLLREMPQLKINCMRVDELFPKFIDIQHDRTSLTSGRTLDLEHVSTFMNGPADRVFSLAEIPKAKHLLLTYKLRFYSIDERDIHDFSDWCGQIETIQFRGCEVPKIIIPTLQAVGCTINSLILDSKCVTDSKAFDGLEDYDIFLILECCPNLTSLTMSRVNVIKSHGQKPKSLRLKKLHLVHCTLDPVFLGWVFAGAPVLEEIVIESLRLINSKPFSRALDVLAPGKCLAKLHSFKFSIVINKHFPQDVKCRVYNSSHKFAKTMLAKCPSLRCAAVDLQEHLLSEGTELKKLDTFLKLVNA